MSQLNTDTRPGGSLRRSEAKRVLQEINHLCADLGPNGRVPKHTDLMRSFAASERMVLNALSELQRQGVIVRRHGAGTFVTDRSPNMSLARMITPHTRTVVAIARPDHSFFDRCMEQLSFYAEEAGLDLVYRPLRPGHSLATADIEALGHPYGFILFGYPFAPLAQPLRDGGARVVVVGTPPLGTTLEVPCVYGAQDHGGYLAAKHLLELGHWRLAFVHTDPDTSQNPRWHGMLRAVREAQRAGREADLTLLTSDETDTWRRDPARAAAFVRRPDVPTALLIWNDHQAAHILSSLLRAGIKVPEELSVVGYDALPEGEILHPALTTVDPFLGQLLRIAIGLLAQPEPPPLSHTATVVPALVIRESTAPPPDFI